MRLKAGRLTDGTTEYPAFSILLVLALILLSPFLSSFLCYFAFAVCIYRVVRYDAKVFATDYCILLPMTQMFRTTGGMSFLIWLCLFAAIWYFLRGTVRANATLVLLLVLVNYLITRMQLVINDFVLCVGQIFILYVLLPRQDAESAERSTKAFCWSVIATSVYALLFRNTPQIVAIRGVEDVAIWGTNIMRFSGLIRDSNYYMTMLLAGMAALCKLKETGKTGTLWFWGQMLVMTMFGILTYSKTFFLMTIVLGGIYIVWQFWSKKVFRGMIFTILGIVAGAYLLLSDNSPFAVVLERFTSGSSLSAITTGRSDLYIRYWNVITENIWNFLFGLGLSAPMLGKGTHMLYLEMIYYVGVTGMILILSLFFSMVQDLQKNNPQIRKQKLIAKYAVVFIVVLQYLTLQGLFQILTYGVFFLSFLTIKITPAGEYAQTSSSAEITQ